MLRAAVQNRSESKVSGTHLKTAPPISTVDIATPIELPIIQRKTSCACGGGCPRCQSRLPIQAKLKIGLPDDKYEQEADRVADQVMRMSDPHLQRQTEPEEEEEEHIQTKPIAEQISPLVQRQAEPEEEEEEPLQTRGQSPQLPEVSSDFDRRVKSLEGKGQSLPETTRSYFEPRFEHDFSDVRIHTNTTAAESARAIGARAFTIGRSVVFGSGQYAQETQEGRRLLAHELAHVVQQGRATALTPTVQRVRTYHGPTRGAPANWPAQVAAARTSAAKAALVQTATGMAVHDATSASASDAYPTTAHLVAYTATNQQINYDENLNSKRSPVDRRRLNLNAGYTLQSGGRHYVILGPQSLDGGRYYLTLRILNHEFDHIRQAIAGSTLRGNESELDAWTTSFIRDFHRTYLLGDTGSTCFVQSVDTWTQLLDYYHRSHVSTAQRDRCVRRLSTYYTSTISGHAGHLAAFRYWVYRSMRRSITPSLADRLNTDLHLGLSASASAASIRQFPCGTTKTLTYQAPTLARPALPSATP